MSAEEEGLETTRWGTRFVRAELEDSYRAWHIASAGTLNRVGAAISGATWVLGIPGLLLLWPRGAVPYVAVILGVHVPFHVWGFVLMRRKPIPRWISAWAVAPIFVSGALLATTFDWLLGMPSAGVAAVACDIYICLLVLRFRPVYPALALAPIVLLESAMLAVRFRHGDVSGPALYVDTVLLAVAYTTGVTASVLSDVASRRSFRQERIIEAQKATIAHERARSEALLHDELGHQVAARSRELGRMLAQVEGGLVPRRPKVGERFDTRYRVERELGAGAMGAVYEVVRLTDDRRLALKVVTGEVSPDRAARFAREAEIGARVRHANLVSIVDVGVADGGVPFLVMELAPHGSLEARRARFGEAAWARPILAGIARGLTALHEAGVVHRDLKPANVLLVGDDEQALEARISDFGISRFGELDSVDVDPNASTLGAVKPHALTGTGVVLGTPYYMAPEAVRTPKLEPSADVFAFGILACEMLTGRAPFAAPPMVTAMAGEHLREPVGLDDARIGAPLAELLRACLAEDPARRVSMRAARDALAAAA